MTSLASLSSSDLFFYYGNNSVELEIEADIVQGLIQPKRSMFYGRSDGCGASQFENYPISFSAIIQLKYDVIKWIAYRNQIISDGTNNLPDRRVAASQNGVNVKGMNAGELDVDVQYLPFNLYSPANSISVPIGR